MVKQMNWSLYKDILSIDSTSGKERELAQWLLEHLEAPSVQSFEVGDGTLNLLLSWGTPQVVFCTHLDTVPPYIPPYFGGKLPSEDLSTPGRGQGEGPVGYKFPKGTQETMGGAGVSAANGVPPKGVIPPEVIWGRGACDAKGQIFAMYSACKALEAQGATGFALLLLAGEETGSWGAKAFAKTGFQAPFVIVGEPTENKLVSAAKGTKAFALTFTGQPFHSGYPEYGTSAVELFNRFYNQLSAKDFGEDPLLGATTWNIGQLHSDNPQNILSGELTCRLYFRTTFVSDGAVQEWMAAQESEQLHVEAIGGDAPARYVTLPGFASAPVAFGSDAPHLDGFGHKLICGPGSIRYAHRPDEHILPQELESAVGLYTQLFASLTAGAQLTDS